MKNLKKFLAVLLVAAMVTGFSGNVCRAKTKSDVYGDLIKQLKKKEQFADGVYTAKIHDASGNDILLVTDAVCKVEGQNAIWADVYQNVNGKAELITTIVSTGSGYPICKKGNYILSGFHHKSMRYKIASDSTIMEQINGLYLNKKYCTYTKNIIKSGKMTQLKRKKIKAKIAEKMDYYIDKNGNMRGKPIKFSRK
ncbi:MAG: hypothetical protein MSH21_10250 [Clostridium sp.]|uniref:hypothetical protein n=1 Tax=Butyribacter sp. TaxID=2822465 RepID=UPI002A9AC930|nr:hypothetical protein [Clostridium sp.]MDY5180299.1 hypothetical protein [Butyribacter sp.]